MMREGEFMKTILKLMVLSMLAFSFAAFATGEETTPPDPAAIDCEEPVAAPGTVQPAGDDSAGAQDAG